MGSVIELFSFKGRNGRLVYLAITVALWIVGLPAHPLLASAQLAQRGHQMVLAVAEYAVVLTLAGFVFWLNLAAVTRRLRDMETSVVASLVVFIILDAVCAIYPASIKPGLGRTAALIMLAVQITLMVRPGRPRTLDDDPGRLNEVWGEVAPPGSSLPTMPAFSGPATPSPGGPGTPFGRRR